MLNLMVTIIAGAMAGIPTLAMLLRCIIVISVLMIIGKVSITCFLLWGSVEEGEKKQPG